MDEVASVSIDQPKGLILVQTKPGKMIDLQDLDKAITGAGFTPREIAVTVSGRVENWNGRATLVVSDTERFFLEPQEKVQQIQKAVEASKKTVSVSGVATHPDTHEEHPHTIVINTFQVR